MGKYKGSILIGILPHVIVVFCYIQYAVSQAGISAFSQMDDILIFILGLALVISRFKKHDFKIKKTHFNLFAFIFLVLFIISAVGNRVPYLNLIVSFKIYFVYTFFFLFLANIRTGFKFGEKIINTLHFCFIMQLPIMMVQIAIAHMGGRFSDDVACGTFASANTLSYSVFFPLFYATYMFFVEGEKNYGWLFWCYLLILILPMGEYGIAAYFALVTLLILKETLKKKSLIKRIVIAGLVTIPLLMAFSVYKVSNSYHSKSFFSTINPIVWYNRITVGQQSVYSGAQRNLYYPLTYVNLNENSKHPLIGMGPGMYASYAAFQLMPEKNMLVYDIFGQIEKGMDPGVDSQFIPIWGEFGYVGLVLFVVFLLGSYVYFHREYKNVRTAKEKGLAITCAGGAIFLLVGFYANHVWEDQAILMTYILFCTSFYKLKEANSNRVESK